ncbi:hypothetical protein F5Y10DRAFT_246613, partial [Nemania abortiva]
MLDAEILGVSRSFVNKYVTPFLDERIEVIYSPNKAQGGKHAPPSSGDNGFAKAKSRRVKAVENHEGQSKSNPLYQSTYRYLYLTRSWYLGIRDLESLRVLILARL